MTIRVGTVLYGYCEGFFGDSHGPKRVEGIGADWVVARDEYGRPLLADFPDGWKREQMDVLLDKWSKNEHY